MPGDGQASSRARRPGCRRPPATRPHGWVDMSAGLYHRAGHRAGDMSGGLAQLDHCEPWAAQLGRHASVIGFAARRAVRHVRQPPRASARSTRERHRAHRASGRETCPPASRSSTTARASGRETCPPAWRSSPAADVGLVPLVGLAVIVITLHDAPLVARLRTHVRKCSGHGKEPSANSETASP